MPLKLNNVLNYQRSILVQTAVLKNKIGPSLYEKIDRGDIHELTLEVLDAFLSAYPKESEIKALKAAISKFNIFDYAEALVKLECGNLEQFMLQVLSHKSDLQQKAEILK